MASSLYTQNCALVFGAWSYHTTKMNLTNASATINLDSYERNGEWEIVSTKVRPKGLGVLRGGGSWTSPHLKVFN